MSTHHDQSIGGPGAVDGIAGSRSGTEGATSGQGVDKGGAPAHPRVQERKPAPALGGNSSDSRQSDDPGVMQTEPRENQQERKPGP
ncbi:hypothetical protein [Duganella radicis]|uniref:Uncharacterized protein n=1 Tax=Duganella radicis TaxID=551988 RepID=A0A6L6PJ08_9BURK|nr:hypothetical protein [Duganella radicis]MTV38255.1 hypothetical protein [Duganella radicis]